MRQTTDSGEMHRELGCSTSYSVEKELNDTIDWYLGNGILLTLIESGEYRCDEWKGRYEQKLLSTSDYSHPNLGS